MVRKVFFKIIININYIFIFLDNEAKKEKILNIIEREFDLELLLKYREMRILEHELERGKELKELLEKLILNGTSII